MKHIRPIYFNIFPALSVYVAHLSCFMECIILRMPAAVYGIMCVRRHIISVDYLHIECIYLQFICVYAEHIKDHALYLFL